MLFHLYVFVCACVCLCVCVYRLYEDIPLDGSDRKFRRSNTKALLSVPMKEGSCTVVARLINGLRTLDLIGLRPDCKGNPRLGLIAELRD